MLRIRTFFLIQNKMKVLPPQRRGGSIYLGMFKVVCFTHDRFLLHSLAFSVLGVTFNTQVDQVRLLDPSLFSQWKNWICDLIFSGQAVKARECLLEAPGTWDWSAEEPSSWWGLSATSSEPPPPHPTNRPPTLSLGAEGGGLHRKLSEIVSWFGAKNLLVSCLKSG